MKYTLLIFTVVILFSCNSEKTKQVIEKPKINQVKVNSNQILVAEVEGMVCKMGCGGAIRKELITTNKVSRVEVDFVEEAKKQTLKIHFDNKLIDQDQIVRTIEKINKGQFKVYPVETIDLNKRDSKEVTSEVISK